MEATPKQVSYKDGKRGGAGELDKFFIQGNAENAAENAEFSPADYVSDKLAAYANKKVDEGLLPVEEKDWFEDVTYISRDNKELTGYPTQKPKELIKRFVLASTNEGDTVSDYYLGSGTTAVVCQELKRNFIGCDINENAIELTKSRLISGV
jgi:DNA modification methylase